MSESSASVIWKGSQLLTESSESPVIEETGTEITITQTYSGPFDVCQTEKPLYGAPCALYPAAAVRKTTVSKMPGGRGKLTVVSSVLESGGGDPSPLADPIVEKDWVRIEKPLAQHPRYKTLGAQSIAMAKAWASDPLTYTGPSFANDPLTTEFASKLQRGQDTYVVFAPVVKLTTEHAGEPDTGGCGKISIPSNNAGRNLMKYKFLKTADGTRSEKGRWSRNQEWTGADDIDNDIYGPNSGLP